MRKVMVDELVPGMYVAELDRPWTDTPFLFQGFFIEKKTQIEELARYCDYVYVDPLRKNESPWRERVARSGMWQRSGDQQASRAEHDGETQDVVPGDPERYPVQRPVEQEFAAARASREATEKALQKILLDLKRGRDLHLVEARGAVGGMVESVVRNPNAMVWLAQMKRLDSYTYGHSIDVCSYLIAFGRHLGLPRPDLHVLGLGGLLLDIGKVRLSLPLLQKRGRLTETEFAELHRHVPLGLEILEKTPGIPERVVAMVREHHERMDGSGYPAGLPGGRTGLFPRMAAIADTFDAITSERPYAPPLSLHQALRRLYAWRETQFHNGLVEQFIECMGTYPVGSIVELNTGQVAIVIAQNRFRQLRPKLMLVLDADKESYGTMDILDLIHEPTNETGYPIEIDRALEPGMYNIHPRDFYL